MIASKLLSEDKPEKASLDCEPKRYHIFLPDLWMFTTQTGPVITTGPISLLLKRDEPGRINLTRPTAARHSAELNRLTTET